MLDLTRPVGNYPCVCGCGGSNGHVLSTEREWPRACGALGMNDEGVFVRCVKPVGHSELVPHGNGDRAWFGLA